jgi:VanZ family protein
VHRWDRLLLVSYLAFLVYGSLYPISSFRAPEESPWSTLLLPARVSKTDALTNVLVYMPLGFCLARVLSRRGALFVAMLGAVLSFGIEYFQAYLPGRVPSLFDWVLNGAGTYAGARIASRLALPGNIREELFLPGARARLGLVAVGTWVLSQLFPFVPSTDVDYLKEGLRPLWYFLRGQAPFSSSDTAVYALSVLSLAIVLESVLRPERRLRGVLAAFFGAVLLAKVPILTRQLSFEAVLGAALGLTGFFLLPGTRAIRVALAAAVGVVLLDGLQGAPGAFETSSFSWIPLRGHLQNELTGIGDILEGAWPFLVLAYVASGARTSSPAVLAGVGAVLVFSGVLAIEWLQQFLPGRSPDVTDALLALLAWSLPWLHPEIGLRSRKSAERERD